MLVGKPVIKGTRLSVEFVVGLLAQGWSEAEVLRNYQALPERTCSRASLTPKDRLKDERVYPVGA